MDDRPTSTGNQPQAERSPTVVFAMRSGFLLQCSTAAVFGGLSAGSAQESRKPAEVTHDVIFCFIAP